MTRTTIFTIRHETLMWTAMMALALALVFLLTPAAGAADTTPALLSYEVQEGARPMPAVESSEMDAPDVDMVMMVWQALDHQQKGEWQDALDLWHALQLAPDADHWRHVAIAQAHLALGSYEEAAEQLDVAEAASPNNAVVHYFRGLLRLEQVDHAYDWYDAMGPADTRYVSYQPDVIPNSRAMYRYTARVELQKAIRFADDVKLDQPLTPNYWYSTMALGPTVGDLLVATGADNFESRAHNILGRLLLEEGALDEAEHHIDQAAAADMFISYSYVDLIEEYESRGYHLDAARVCAKAVGQGLDEDTARARALANLRLLTGR